MTNHTTKYHKKQTNEKSLIQVMVFRVKMEAVWSSKH